MKQYHCIDCGKKISLSNGLYGKGRCRSCAHKGVLAHNYKGGIWINKPHCLDCGKNLKNYKAKRCKSCNQKNLSLTHPRKDKNAGGFKDGRTLKKHFCIDCRKELNKNAWYVRTKRCKKCNYNIRRKPRKQKFCIDCEKEISKNAKRCCSCSSKLKNKGKKNGNYINGRGREPYPLEFGNKLKEQIRERDNRICQMCGKMELDCYRKLDIHHIDYDKHNINPENLVSLCQSCHLQTNFNREIYLEYFKILRGILCN